MDNEDTRHLTTPTQARPLLPVHHSNNIDQGSGKDRCPQWRSKKLKNRRMNKAAQQVPKAILKLQDYKYRESALTKLSTFLLEKREEDPDNYYITGHLLYNSCSTMTILLQIEYVAKLQCIAAGRETRHKFVKSSTPNFLVPLLMFKAPLEEIENVRVVALSVIGILCQARESDIIQWAVESNMVEVCRISVEIGNELSKVVGMHIIEAILQDDSGLSYICDLKTNQLKELVATLCHLVTFLDLDRDFSPHLLFHVIRCCFLLCKNLWGYDLVRGSLPDTITSCTFHPITELWLYHIIEVPCAWKSASTTSPDS